MSALYSKQPYRHNCVAERSRKGKTSTAAVPQFADTDKAEAWQKLTNLQQQMMGLITAVEDQLKLSDSPKSAGGCQAAAAAEQIADATHSAVEIAEQQQEQKLQGSAATPAREPLHESQTCEQPETHTSGVKADAEDPHGKTDAAAGDDDAQAQTAAAAGSEAAACTDQQVGATHVAHLQTFC